MAWKVLFDIVAALEGLAILGGLAALAQLSSQARLLSEKTLVQSSWSIKLQNVSSTGGTLETCVGLVCAGLVSLCRLCQLLHKHQRGRSEAPFALSHAKMCLVHVLHHAPPSCPRLGSLQ